MNYDDMRCYILRCGAGETSCTKERVDNIFRDYNRGVPGDIKTVWAFEGFCDFYHAACLDRVDHVWNDLAVYKFRYDLQREDEVKEEDDEKRDCELLHCWMLSQNDEWFEILFNDCLQSSKDEQIRTATANLLFRMPTNPSIKRKVIEHEYDWKSLMESNNLNAMMYVALICESMFGVSTWRRAFLTDHKGFDFLFKIMFLLHEKTVYLNGCLFIESDDEIYANRRVLRMIHSFLNEHTAFNPVMSNILLQFTRFDESEAMEYGVKQSKNHFAHFVCLSAKFNKISVSDAENKEVNESNYKEIPFKADENEPITFCKGGLLPSRMIKIYLEPLVFGFVHEVENESLSAIVSHDILQLLLAFFC